MEYGTDLPLDPDWGEISKIPVYAEKIEKWGYDSIWYPDERYGRNIYAVLTLAALGTTRASLGVSVTNPYTRHPLITGAGIASVNEASGGRAILGIGAGASTLFDRQGLTRPYSPVTAIKEAVKILHPFLWGKTVDFCGETIKVRNADIDFESQNIPLYIAARGPKLLQLAGEIADGVIIGSLASEEGLEYAFENIKIGLETSGRELKDIKTVFWGYTAISENYGKAKSLVENLVVSSMWSSKGIIDRLGINREQWTPIERELKNGFGKGLPANIVYRSAAEKVSDDIIDSWALAGPVDKVRKRIREIEKRGLDQFAMLTMGRNREEKRVMQQQFSEHIIKKI
jgi:5,10-methylenetetrahydromethanopterin reductase